jgi:nitric oxide reductase subunit B
MSVQNKLSDANVLLWGHQGYEYVDLGRGWQILLFVGLLIWLFLVADYMWEGENELVSQAF